MSLLESDDLGELLTLPTRISAAGRRVAEIGTNIIHAEVENQARSQDVNASGDFIRSLEESLFVPVEDFYSASIGSTKPYAEQIEQGRLPGVRPPIPAILQWMTYKGKEATLFGAMMIAQKIASEGYEGKHIFENALESGADKVLDEFEKQLDVVIGND